jgi:hypothetical protein
MATTAAPELGTDYMIEREKSLGLVVVDILDNRITTQRADRLASGMFADGVKLFWKSADGLSRWYRTAWADDL